ncbi:MAG: hypothetical protein DRZ82_01675 [Thermoprotei archaeon]|nr:MAG: hypothetical protein DRZ82_01675 [Thermoprotei archaeon]
MVNEKRPPSPLPPPPPSPRPLFPLREILRAVVLKIVKSEGEIHGLSVYEKVKEKYGIEIPKPVIYRTLRSLEADGFLVSRWKVEESGPAKRMYRITDEGEEYLKHVIERIRKMIKLIEKLVK